jgi:hypothetical protein
LNIPGSLLIIFLTFQYYMLKQETANLPTRLQYYLKGLTPALLRLTSDALPWPKAKF